MTGRPCPSQGPGRTWLLEWRGVGAGPAKAHSVVLRSAADAVRHIAGFARFSRYGEYRVTLTGGKPVYTSAALIREWDDEVADAPSPIEASRWRRELRRAVEGGALVACVRAALDGAARRGLVSLQEARMVVATLERILYGDPQVGDRRHGPLA